MNLTSEEIDYLTKLYEDVIILIFQLVAKNLIIIIVGC